MQLPVLKFTLDLRTLPSKTTSLIVATVHSLNNYPIMSGPASNLRARKTNGAAATNGNGAATNGKAANGTMLSYAIPTEYGQAMDRKLDTHQSYVCFLYQHICVPVLNRR